LLNVLGAMEITLDVFGGNNLDMQPTDLPAGLSPDNSDCAFLPGSVFTRPSLTRKSSLGTTSQVVYAKTYLKPDGSFAQAEFTSDGKMWVDGLFVGMTRKLNRFYAHNAFGKLFIATSDGTHGVDVPLQYTAEGYLDRVSQDGPGAGATLGNYSIPQVALVTGSAGAGITISTAIPTDLQSVQTTTGQPDESGYVPPQYENYYTSLDIVTASAHGLIVGALITTTGNTLYNQTSAYVTQVVSATDFKISYFGQTNSTGTGGTVSSQGPLLARINNQVVATTATPHKLRVGYKVLVAGVAPLVVGGGISSLVIDNSSMPGLAAINTYTPHLLVPGNVVTLTNVAAIAVGGGINTIVVHDGVATLTMNAAEVIQAGATVIVQSSGGPYVSFVVGCVISPTVFTYLDARADVTLTGGSVQVTFPTSISNRYTVQTVVNATSFTVPVSYSNGTWASGNLTFDWNGSFFVTSIASATVFAYSNIGPNALVQTGTGTATPVAQIAPGVRKCVVIFLTRTGYLTIPSPSVTFTASGGQYLIASNIPIGPTNVVARWLAFTGANGGSYYALPVPPRDPATGQIIGTSTVIGDNTTTTAIFDFADEALQRDFAIDIPGNNLFRQEVLGPCAAFFSYASRLIAWGEANKIQQFYNMGFEGGYYATAPTVPLGWSVTGTGGTLIPGPIYGSAWQVTGGGTGTDGAITQPAYQDRNGVAILQSNTFYKFRLKAFGAGRVNAEFYSPSVGVLSTATLALPLAADFIEGGFSYQLPVVIPPDTVLRVYASGMTAGQVSVFDEMEVVYYDNPYRLTARFSYANNPEAFDGVTGILGPANDSHAVFGMEERKDVLCLLTAGPDGSLYESEDTASGEPVTWTVRHVASKCGLTSIWGIAKFEDWFCWTSDTGIRVFDGSNIEKISQEIQPWWDGINPAAKQLTVLANDPYTRRLYCIASQGTAIVANAMYVLDYRDLNTYGLLANSGTLRVGMSGKVITSDLTRKWSPWSMTMNHCALMTYGTGAVMVFCGGTGSSLDDAAHSAIYTLIENVITGIDADYGAFWQNSRYPTHFFDPGDDAQQRGLGLHRLLHTFLSMNCTGVGAVYVTPLLDHIANPSRSSRALAVNEGLQRDLEIGLNVAAERISYEVRCQPAGAQPAAVGSPAGFRLSSITIAMKTHPYSPLRGKNR
jgi:hypothetical protein